MLNISLLTKKKKNLNKFYFSNYKEKETFIPIKRMLPWNIYEILKYGKIGDQIIVKGWIRRISEHGDVTFLDIYDGSTIYPIQIIISENKSLKE